jgi:hypothetical protein
MSENKKIEALQVLVDLRSGFTKSQLIEKDDLSYHGLKSLLTQLKGVLSQYSVTNGNGNALPLGKREINAKEVLCDLRAGFNDAALMEKYKLSAVGLNGLKTKLTNANLLQAKRQISIDPIVKDLKLGITEPDLMEKHRLTWWELQEIGKRLEEIGLVASEEVRHLTFLSDPIADANTLSPVISMSVYESRDSETLGELLYVRGDTVGLRGLSGTVGATKVIVVQSVGFQQGKPLVFDAKCVATREPTEHGPALVEFRISNIAPCVMREFRELTSTCMVSREQGELAESLFMGAYEEMETDQHGDDLRKPGPKARRRGDECGLSRIPDLFGGSV